MHIPGIAAFSLIVGCACANPAPRPSDDSNAPPSAGGSEDEGGADTATTPMANEVKIRVGATTLTASLRDNETTSAFKEMLPLTLTMADLNANEKHADLPRALPTSASNPGTIHAGDLMLYGSRTLVLFYETFSTSYAYTRIGKVDDVSGLTTALGSGDVTVTFVP
jgi:hypothetical protein